MSLNETHASDLRSWVESASQPRTDFPIQNLPFGVFRRAGTSEAFRGGTAIGDYVVDLRAALEAKVFAGSDTELLAAAAQPRLNDFMAMGPTAWSSLRLALSRALRKGSSAQERLRACLVPQEEAEYGLAAQIGDYTDFYTSIHHAVSVGKRFRPDNPLLPNYKWVPIGYHGRCSSIAVSPQRFVRPSGQVVIQGATTPTLGASTRLDYEVELGILIGPGNSLGTPVGINEAESHVFGLCLLNDWSARDLQAWEYQPLGPFLGKNFATTISPWIVTLEALEPHRSSWIRPPTEPRPLPYLDSSELRNTGAIDITLEAHLETQSMRRAGTSPHLLSRTSFKHAYWTVAQLVAHHTVNGCNLQPGDLLGTGTQSGPRPEEAGSLLELSQGGTQAVSLANGEKRTFLEDGDSVVLRGFCERPGAVHIGFGEARGYVLPAQEQPASATTAQEP